ncbi:MAG: nucleoside phosphorylase [Clostridia bacterium]|nr:nucleoside phosphorylase [Clostridia bacterium]
MIVHSFDNQSEPVFGPEAFLGPQRHLCELCILTFSERIFGELQTRFPVRTVGTIRSVNGEHPICLFEYAGKTIGALLLSVGATGAGNDLIELNWQTGATKFLAFGSAGSLNRAETEGKYVIPTEAYRDEGMSYHYAPPADYIRIGTADALANLFDELRLPYVKGRVWTTDAPYRETRNQVAARQAEGCIAVEMELSGLQAICNFHGFTLYDFLVTGDVLDAPVYENEGLHDANHNFDKLDIALELAKRI